MMEVKVADWDGIRNTWFWARVSRRGAALVAEDRDGNVRRVRRSNSIPGGIRYATERSFVNG